MDAGIRAPSVSAYPVNWKTRSGLRQGVIPAEVLSYHLIRAFHLSDTCVACGACQEACPVNIPLLALQLSMREMLRETYGYEAGLDPERKSPILYRSMQGAESGAGAAGLGKQLEKRR